MTSLAETLSLEAIRGFDNYLSSLPTSIQSISDLSIPITQKGNPFPLPPFLSPTPTTHWPDSFQSSIDSALSRAWASATQKSYKHGINKYLSFCRKYGIHPSLIFPANDYLLCAFTADLAHHLSQTAIKNVLSGLRAWHISNGFDFQRSQRLATLARTSVNHPLPLRKPVTLAMIGLLCEHLSSTTSLDLSIRACALLAFWGLARLGELLPNRLSDDLSRLPKTMDFHANGNDSFLLHLPWTKTKLWLGHEIIIPKQHHPYDPLSAMSTHLKHKDRPSSSTLFAYAKNNVFVPLDKQVFLSRCNTIWISNGLSRTTGHSFRIGGASHLLACGISPDIVKTLGRWSSDSFLRYWRDLSLIVPQHVKFATMSSEPH